MGPGPFDRSSVITIHVSFRRTLVAVLVLRAAGGHEGLIQLYPVKLLRANSLTTLFRFHWNTTTLRLTSTASIRSILSMAPAGPQLSVSLLLGASRRNPGDPNQTWNASMAWTAATLCGMDDSGEMSSVVFFNAICFYPYSLRTKLHRDRAVFCEVNEADVRDAYHRQNNSGLRFPNHL